MWVVRFLSYFICSVICDVPCSIDILTEVCRSAKCQRTFSQARRVSTRVLFTAIQSLWTDKLGNVFLSILHSFVLVKRHFCFSVAAFTDTVTKRHQEQLERLRHWLTVKADWPDHLVTEIQKTEDILVHNPISAFHKVVFSPLLVTKKNPLQLFLSPLAPPSVSSGNQGASPHLSPITISPFTFSFSWPVFYFLRSVSHSEWSSIFAGISLCGRAGRPS